MKMFLGLIIAWSIIDIVHINSFLSYCDNPLRYKKIFFSNRDNIPALLVSLINNENKYIKAAYYTFTHSSISKALINAKKRDVDIEVIVDSYCINRENPAIKELIKNKIPVLVYYSPFSEYPAIMHHKFMIFGEQKCNLQSLVATGSFNCTRAAAERHRENLIVLEGSDAVSEYVSEFNEIKDECLINNK